MNSARLRELRLQDRRRSGSAALVLLALLALSGCQGLSAGGSSSSPPPQTQSGDLSLSTSKLDFGSIVVGKSSTLTLTATNSGTATLTISGAAPSTKEFSLSAPKLPLNLAAGQKVTLSVVFTPDTAATVNGSIALSSNASDGAALVTLSGIGVTAGQLSAGYNNN